MYASEPYMEPACGYQAEYMYAPGSSGWGDVGPTTTGHNSAELAEALGMTEEDYLNMLEYDNELDEDAYAEVRLIC